jgi:mannose-6-phosphate isomerase-like protein (cupin superfamily)
MSQDVSSGNQLDCSQIGMIMTITKSSKDTNGKSLEMEWLLAPRSGGTPVHIHPEAIETYEILNGQLEVFKGDKWITAKAGDKVTIEKGEPHTFRNATNDYVRVYNTHQPAMQFEGFFKGLHKFANSGLVKNGKMSFKSVAAIATLWGNYPREIVSVKPPAFVMRIMGAIGRLMGTNIR